MLETKTGREKWAFQRIVHELHTFQFVSFKPQTQVKSHNNFLATVSNDTFVMIGHNNSESYETQVRIR